MFNVLPALTVESTGGVEVMLPPSDPAVVYSNLVAYLPIVFCIRNIYVKKNMLRKPVMFFQMVKESARKEPFSGALFTYERISVTSRCNTVG